MVESSNSLLKVDRGIAVQKANRIQTATNKLLDRSPRRSVSNFGDRVGGGSVNMVVRQYRSCMMSDTVTIIGVHEIEAGEPVHLIEIEVTGDADRFDFGDVTQADENVPRDNWQCAYDEREIYSPTAGRRFAFFLHYRNFELPLATSFGDIDIPEPTPIPERLGTIEYEAP